MTQDQWTAVDQYFTDALHPHDDVLEAALKAADDAGLPAIQVAPNQGKFLSLLAQSIGARSILEIGTLGGYSTIWLARALPPDGHLITLELEQKHANVAADNLIRAGLMDKVEIRVGAALNSLEQIASEGRAPFDFVFIDADKQTTAEYFAWSLKMTRVGGIIVVDNVVRKGDVVNPDSTDASVQGIRRFIEAAKREPRITATAIQTVGSKGYDGLAIALVTG